MKIITVLTDPKVVNRIIRLTKTPGWPARLHPQAVFSNLPLRRTTIHNDKCVFPRLHNPTQTPSGSYNSTSASFTTSARPPPSLSGLIGTAGNSWRSRCSANCAPIQSHSPTEPPYGTEDCGGDSLGVRRSSSASKRQFPSKFKRGPSTIVHQSRGRGRITLFGINPELRATWLSTFRFPSNALSLAKLVARPIEDDRLRGNLT